MVEPSLRCGPGPSDRGSVRAPPAANRRQDSCKQKEIAQGDEFKETGQILHDAQSDLGIGHLRVIDEIDEGGEQGDSGPGEEPEAAGLAARGYTREQGNEPDEILRTEDFAGGDQKADQADEGLREVDAFAQVQPIDGEQASDGQQGVAGRHEADQRAADVERAEDEAEYVRYCQLGNGAEQYAKIAS